MIRRMLRLVVFGVLLALFALVVPDGGRTEPGFALLRWRPRTMSTRDRT